MGEEYVPSKRATFLYFAYGSNLWTKRLHLQNSSAVRKGTAQLKVNQFSVIESKSRYLIMTLSMQGYRLDFSRPGEPGEPSIWNGSSATIVEDEKRTVWGAVYEIDLMHMASLDIQEGVHIDYYVPLIKEVETPDGQILECRTYQMTKIPVNAIKLSDSSNPDVRKPSKSQY